MCCWRHNTTPPTRNHQKSLLLLNHVVRQIDHPPNKVFLVIVPCHTLKCLDSIFFACEHYNTHNKRERFPLVGRKKHPKRNDVTCHSVIVVIKSGITGMGFERHSLKYVIFDPFRFSIIYIYILRVLVSQRRHKALVCCVTTCCY